VFTFEVRFEVTISYGPKRVPEASAPSGDYKCAGAYWPWAGCQRRATVNALFSSDAVLAQDCSVAELLTRDQIEAALTDLDRELGRAGQRATIHLVGGAVMCLVFRARDATKDVDAWFDKTDAVRAAAARVASARDLPSDWLNDAAKAYIPEHAQFEAWRALPNLEILVADTRTLFAMKCAAARTEEDASDIRVLARHLGLASSADALRVVQAYYSPDRLPVRSRLLLEELLDDRP
jgi:hypothetical protein